MSETAALRRLRQKDNELGASLGYTVRFLSQHLYNNNNNKVFKIKFKNIKIKTQFSIDTKPNLLGRDSELILGIHYTGWKLLSEDM